MGRRIVKVSKELIESIFSQGSETHHRIAQGLPAGTVLCTASFQQGFVCLEFEHQDWPESSETIDIVVQDTRTAPFSSTIGPQERT